MEAGLRPKMKGGKGERWKGGKVEKVERWKGGKWCPEVGRLSKGGKGGKGKKLGAGLRPKVEGGKGRKGGKLSPGVARPSKGGKGGKGNKFCFVIPHPNKKLNKRP